MSIITLLTDFGLADSYVAEVKGAVWSRAPDVTLVDITHHVPPGDLRAGQYLLSRSWAHFPRGSVHLAVVDPGVGTERRALIAESGGHCFLAPDNGLLSFLPADARFLALSVPPRISATFHGRDVFAPAAAALATGEPMDALGAPIIHPVRTPLPTPREAGGRIVGEILYVDHFGTLITNIPAEHAKSGGRIQISGRDVGPVRRTFADVPRGELVAFVGSGGTIEVAVRDGNAAVKLSAGVGTEVRLEA